MAAELLDVYRSTTDPNLVQEATENLLSLYENPQVIYNQLEILNSPIEIVLKQAVIIGLKMTLNKHWDSIHLDPSSAEIRNIILQILSNEQNPILQTALIDAISPIITYDLEIWPDFLNFIQSLANTQFSYYMQLRTQTIGHLPVASISENIQEIYQQILAGITTQDQNIIKHSCELLIELSNLLSLGVDFLSHAFGPLLNAFMYSIQNKLTSTSAVIKALAHVIASPEEFCDINVLFTKLLEMLDQSSEQQYLVVDPLIVAVKRFPEYSNLISNEILTALIKMGSSLVDDICFDQMENVLYVSRFFGVISNWWNIEQVFQFLVEINSEEDINLKIFLMYCFIELAENSAELTSSRFSEFMELSITSMDTEIHTLAESGLTLAICLLGEGFGNFIQNPDEFLGCIIKTLNIDDEQIHYKALSAISKLLFSVEISSETYNDLITCLVSVVESIQPSLLYLAVTCFTALILSAGENILPFFSNLNEIFQHTISVGDNNPLVQLRSLEGLCCLIRYFPEQTIESHEACLQLVISTMTNQDPSVVASGLTGLKFLLKSQAEIISDVQSFVKPILSTLSLNIDMEMTPQDIIDSNNEVHQLGFQCLTKIIKKQVLDAESVVSIANVALLALLNVPVFDTQLSAIKLLVIASKQVPDICNKFISKLVGMITGTTQQTCLAFEGLTKIIKNFVEFDPTVMKNAIETALSMLGGDRECVDGDDENENEEKIAQRDFELKNSIFMFLAEAAFKFPSLIPIEDVFEIATYFKETENIVDYTEMLGIFVEIFDTQYNNIPIVFRKNIGNCFLELLNECNFQIPTHAISGVRTVIEKENTVSQKSLQIIMNFVETLFNSEFDGSFYFYPSIGSTISLLMSIMRINPELVNEELFNICLNNLPQRFPPSESDNIIDTLFDVFQKNLIPENSVLEFLRVLSSVITFSKRKIKILELKQNSIMKCCVAFHKLCAMTGSDVEKTLAQFVQNEIILEKALNLINQSLEQQ